jgi:D-alanyl-D-alanine endopeptidase (penicillin-binding protein 7)
MEEYMVRKFIVLSCLMAMIVSPVAVEAATKKAPAKHKTEGSKHKSHAAKKPVSSQSTPKSSVSGHKIIHTLRTSKKYHMQAVSYHREPAVFKEDVSSDGTLKLASTKALILNQNTGEVLYAKSTDQATPIASVTKLMTAMVVLDAHQSLDESVTVTDAEVDTLKGTSSRLRVGTTLTRGELLQLALMASENRAAAALGNHYPGGFGPFVAAMNAKAAALGMTRSHFVDGTGLNSDNVSTAEDLAKMVKAAYEYPEIRQVTTTPSYEVAVHGVSRPVEFLNTNILVRNSDWEIGLSKTGYISEAGRCLVMQAKIAGQPMIIVLLDSWGKYTRIGDAQRVRKWIESSNGLRKVG